MFLAIWMMWVALTIIVGVFWDELADALISNTLRRNHARGNIEGYMERTWVLKYREWPWLSRYPWLGYVFRVSARIHHILRSDTDRHLHDHPGWTISIILKGSYIEHMPAVPGFNMGRQQAGIYDEPTRAVVRRAGHIVLRRAADRHRLEVAPGETVWSLFVMGPKMQDWGFYVPNLGKVYWRAYLLDWKAA